MSFCFTAGEQLLSNKEDLGQTWWASIPPHSPAAKLRAVGEMQLWAVSEVTWIADSLVLRLGQKIKKEKKQKQKTEQAHSFKLVFTMQHIAHNLER